MIAAIIIAATRFLIGGHARWQGCAPEARQRIYFANHSSHLDTIVLWAALPAPLRKVTRPVAAQDYWGTGPLRRFIATRVLGAVLVDRNSRKDPLGPLRQALEGGASLILFPEGTRRNEAEPGSFKSGLFHLARHCPQVELVPVYLTNLARAYPKGAILPVPISCVASFGTPIQLELDETRQAFLERAREAVRAAGENA